MTVTVCCQALQSFCFCWHLCELSKALQLHFLRQKETEVITPIQTTVLMSWALQIYKCQLHTVTDRRFSFPDENLVSLFIPERANATGYIKHHSL